MGFYNNELPFDLSEVHIERMFITEFMPIASGLQVKVYLLGLTYVSSNQSADNYTLAQALDCNVEDIKNAWRFWENIGIIKCHDKEVSGDFDVEFLSLRGLYIGSNYENKNPRLLRDQRQSAPSTLSSPFYKDIDTQKKLIKSVEGVIGKALRTQEYRDLSDMYDHYYANIDIITRAFEVNYKERRISNIKAVKTLLNQWLEEGLSSVEDINDYLEFQNKRFHVYKSILRCLGITFRLPNEAEKELIDQWIDDYGFTENDLESIIKSLSKKTLNINFSYIQKILTDLHAKDIHTFEAFEAQSPKANTSSTRSTTSAQEKRHRFTMQKDTQYSEEELEDMLLNRKK